MAFTLDQLNTAKPKVRPALTKLGLTVLGVGVKSKDGSFYLQANVLEAVPSERVPPDIDGIPLLVQRQCG